MAAEKALELEREAGNNGWNEEVERICWGEIREHVVESVRHPAEPGMPFDEVVDYDFNRKVVTWQNGLILVTINY